MGGGDRRDFPVPLAFLPLYYPALPRGVKVGLFPLACHSLRFFVIASIRRMRGNLIRDCFVAESTLRTFGEPSRTMLCPYNPLRCDSIILRPCALASLPMVIKYH